MNIRYLVYSSLMVSLHAFSMHESALVDVRKVVSFTLTDVQTQKEKSLLPTTCYMTEDGDLVSSETGIKYELSSEQVKIIHGDWQAMNMRRSLFDDYLLQTSLQQASSTFVRVGINYDEVKSDEDDKVTDFLWNKVLAKRASQKSMQMPNAEHGCVAKRVEITIENSKIKSFTLVDPFSYQRRYAQASLQGRKIIVTGEKSYNNEGVIYYGESEMDDQIVSEMQTHIKREMRYREYNPRDLTLWYVTLALHKHVAIDVLIKIEENDLGPFSFLFDKEPVKAVQQEIIQHSEGVQPEAKNETNSQSYLTLLKEVEVGHDSTMFSLEDIDELEEELVTQERPQLSQATWRHYFLYAAIPVGIIALIAYICKKS